MKPNFQKYWDINVPKSYNCLFNFICGGRGTGKSFGAKYDFAKQFIKNGSQFTYLRRTKEELKKLTTQRDGQFWDDISPFMSNREFKVESDKLFIDKEIGGYAHALTTAMKLKSTPFPGVTDILFDEFIIDERGIGAPHYLFDEVTKFFEYYETIARERDVRVWFLANALSTNNPYFDEFGLTLPEPGKIKVFRNKDVLIQNVVSPEVAASKMQSRFYSHVVGDSRYRDYAIQNKTLLDDDTFIAKKPKNAKMKFVLWFHEKPIGVWFDPKYNTFYCSPNYDPNCEIQYSATTQDHQPNRLILSGQFQGAGIRLFKAAYECGNMRFENQKTKGWVRDIMRWTR